MLYLWSWANPGADIEYWCNYILIPHASPYTPHWHTPGLASPQNIESLESTPYITFPYIIPREPHTINKCCILILALCAADHYRVLLPNISLFFPHS